MAETTFVSIATESPGTVGAIGAAIIAAVVWVKRVSKLKVGLTRDRAEEGVIHTLEKQRDDAIAAKDKAEAKVDLIESDREKARIEVARLTSEVEHLREHVETLEGLVHELSQELRATRREVTDCLKSNQYRAI